MTKIKKLFTSGLSVILFVGMLGLYGCGGVSEEQLAELDALSAEVNALQKEVNSLKSEKTKLEREIAEKNAKLEECANAKAETQANLQKMGK